jgi:glycerol-3-phosphate dehydrogenase (NAD(P)+)
MSQQIRVGVIGAGSWGTALALLLAKNGHSVTLWAYEREVVESIAARRENEIYLPGVRISPGVRPTDEIGEAVEGQNVIVSAVPSHTARGLMNKIKPILSSDALFISATKGIEIDTLCTMSQMNIEVFGQGFSERAVYLSGPTFAKEVAAGMPTVVTVAGKNPDAAKRAQVILNGSTFRVYTNSDVVGVEIGGSLKNVMAIAAGMSDGLGFGYNSRAALITRGLAEMSRLGIAMGADPLTFIGLAGIGDLVLTCTGDLSRNRTVGVRIGKGEPIDSILSSMRMVAEGVKTTKGAHQLAAQKNVELPITNEVYMILYEKKNPERAVVDLMSRQLKDEMKDIKLY